MKKRYAPAALLILACLVGFGFRLRAAPQQWEYRTYVVPDERQHDDLKQLGEQGWELVTSHPYPYKPSQYTLYFKRPK